MSIQLSKTELAQLNREALLRNMATVGEFARFRPLFKDGAATAENAEELQQLMAEYQQRFDLYSEIYIVDLPPKDPNSRVLEVILPKFRRTNLVNDLGPEAMLAARAYSSVLQTPRSPISMEHPKAEVQMLRTLGAAVTTPPVPGSAAAEQQQQLERLSQGKPGDNVEDLLNDME